MNEEVVRTLIFLIGMINMKNADFGYSGLMVK